MIEKLVTRSLIIIITLTVAFCFIQSLLPIKVNESYAGGGYVGAISVPIPTPIPRLPAVSVSLDAAGMATWSDTNESSFTVQFFRNGAQLGSTLSLAANTTSYNFASIMIDPYFGVYTVVVTARGNGTSWLDGPPSSSPALTVQPIVVPTTSVVVDDNAKTYIAKGNPKDNEFIISGDILALAMQKHYSVIAENDVARIRIPVDVIDKDIAPTAGQHLYVRIEKVNNTALVNMIKNNDPYIIAVKGFCDFNMGVVSGVLLPRRIYNFCTPLEIDIKNITQIQTFHQAAVYHVIPQYGSNGSLTKVDVNYSGGKAFPAKTEIKYYTDHFSYYIVMERKQTFDDIKTSWAQGAIELLAARKILYHSEYLKTTQIPIAVSRESKPPHLL